MTNYIRGMKRQQIIKKWLQGIDDPDYEVFPTKKEGKYIVKKRVEPLNTESNDNTNEQTDDQVDESVPEEEVKPSETPTPKSKALSSKSEPTPAPKPKPIPTVPKRIRDADPADLTINYEILNQLKELGNEIKQQRIKKEQKTMIKHVVQKQMSKRKKPIQYASDEDEDEDDQYEEAEQPTPKVQTKHKRTESFGGSDSLPPSQPVFKSRIRR